MKRQEEKNTTLDAVLDGVKDVEIIRQLFKNTTSCCVDDVSERLQYLWGLGKIGDI